MIKSDLASQHREHECIIHFFRTTPSLWDSDETPIEDVQRIETHGATVLLGRDHAIKIKKPVLFDHMDYSTSEKRRDFCNREVDLNRRTAPELYLGVFAIYKQSNAEFSLSGTDKPVDYFIKMQRFADGNRLDNVSSREGLSALLCEQLCNAVVNFHKNLPSIENGASIPDFHSVIEQNFLQLDDYCPDLFRQKDVSKYRRNLHSVFDALKPVEHKRLNEGWIRAGHGDLHLQNICLFDGKPLLFDAIEYEDDFVVGDVFYDLCFLLMDLWHRNHKQAANQIFNQYIHKMGWTTADNNLDILLLLPFFMTMRAGIRTHVAASRYLQSDDGTAKDLFANEARLLLNSSLLYLKKTEPQIVAIGGFSGSGKSTLAANLASHVGSTPGALHIRSDVVRRMLIGWDDYSPMPQSAYTTAQSQAVYEHMQVLARRVVIAGHSVILDAVLDRRQDRQEFEKIAQDLDVPFKGIWLKVDRNVMAERIEGRTRDASDATVEVMLAQIQRQIEAVTDWMTLEANGSEIEITQEALLLLR